MTMVDLSQPATGTRSGRRGSPATPPQVLLIVCAGVVLASLDLFIVNVALPSIARDFHGSGLGELSWVLNGYAIMYASLLVLFGRFADRYPRERGPAGRGPAGPGGGRGPAHADLAGPGAGVLPGRAAQWRGPGLGRHRGAGRGPRPGGRWPARHRELA